MRATGQAVAVKVQRPGALSTISKDLYVMRRGVGVYESLVKRFTAQTTDYQQLLSTFAEGLYTGACTVPVWSVCAQHAVWVWWLHMQACLPPIIACTLCPSYCSCRQGAQSKPCAEQT